MLKKESNHMAKTFNSLVDLIGRTPLLHLKNYEVANSTKANIIAKLEFFNPAGSVKGRIAKAMIEDAEEKGRLNPDSIIIEPTSGNTGIGLAVVAAARGYKVILKYYIRRMKEKGVLTRKGTSQSGHWIINQR